VADITLRTELRAEDRSAIEVILRGSGAFKEAEVAVGLELVDETLDPRPDTDYLWTIAERVGRLIGFACHGLVPMTDGTFDLYWLAVAADVRGAGVAGLLDRSVEEDVRRRGGRWVLAETSSTEPYAAARRFYEKQGYTVVGNVPDFYRDGDDRLTFGKRT
jgi:ribosomal protein S18 acetylase RimI-like enzyme